MHFRLGQRVRHVGLGITVRLLGRSEADSQVLVDYDGSGQIRWWCPPRQIAMNDNQIDAANMYYVSALERMRGERLASTLKAERAELERFDDPQHALQLAHLIAYAARRGMPFETHPRELVAANDA